VARIPYYTSKRPRGLTLLSALRGSILAVVYHGDPILFLGETSCTDVTLLQPPSEVDEPMLSANDAAVAVSVADVSSFDALLGLLALIDCSILSMRRANSTDAIAPRSLRRALNLRKCSRLLLCFRKFVVDVIGYASVQQYSEVLRVAMHVQCKFYRSASK
jgi:hypothetical protein